MNAKTDQATSAERRRNHLLEVLVRRRWQLFGCLLLVCGIAFAATSLRRPKYEAAARVQVTKDQPQIGGMASLVGGADRDYFSTQCQLLRSRRVLAQAAQNLNMSGGHWVFSDAGVKELQQSIKIKPVPGSRLIDIVATAETAPKAAAIANQIAAVYIETSARARQATNERLIARVQEQIDRYDDESVQMEETIRRFRQENLITGANSTMTAVESRIARLEAELTQTQMKRLSLESQRETYRRMLASGQGLTVEDQSLPELDEEATTRTMRQELRLLQQQESRMAKVYLPGHQKLRDTRVRIAELQAELVDHKRNLLQSLMENATESYAATVAQEDSLQQVLNQQKEIGVKLTAQNQEYQKLLNEAKMIQQFKAECLAKIRQFTLEEGMSVSPVVVVDAAQVPQAPAGLSKAHQAASILLLGLVFSIGFTFALERLGGGRPPEEAAQAAQPPLCIPGPNGRPIWVWPHQAAAPCPSPSPLAGADAFGGSPDMTGLLMGQIEPIRLGGDSESDTAFAGRCRIVDMDPGCSAAQQLREISSNLLLRFGETRQTMVVTSVLPRSGKTTCACALAISLARAGRQVVLVEANASRPALQRVFRAAAGSYPSAGDAMADPTLLEEALRPTDVDNLSVLLHSSEDPFPNERTESSLLQMHDRLHRRFDWVIYDAGAVQQDLTKELLQVVGKSICVTSGSENPQEVRGVQIQVELGGAVNVGVIENAHLSDRSGEPDRQTMFSSKSLTV